MEKKTVIMVAISVLTLTAILVFYLKTTNNKSECLNDENSDAERDCFLELVCKDQNFNVCERMPEDTPERTGNKLLCVSLVASLTHDLSYCKKQQNPFIANTCLYSYRRWVLDFDQDSQEEFKDLRKKYGCSL